ncbi:MAG: hypothetical protein K5786_07235 [Treponema sp.]|nr:hypothetical protein [Treponema sp.]
MEEKQVVADEVCEKEFNEWCEANGIDYDVSNMNEESAEAFNKNKSTMKNAAKAGRLVFDGGKLEYTVSAKSPENYAGNVLKIGEPTGKIFTAMDGLKETQLFKKQTCVMSALTGKDTGYFDKLHASDWKLLQAIVVFFLTI